MSGFFPYGKAVAVVVAALLSTGCASVERATGTDIYASVGVGYQLDEESDWYVRTYREWQCGTNAQAHVGLHAERGPWTLSLEHQSWYFCGGHNNRAELYQNDVRLTRTFGRD